MAGPVTTLEETLRELEHERTTVVAPAKTLARVVGIASAVLVAVTSLTGVPYLPWIFLVPVLFVGLRWGIARSHLKSSFKSRILPALIAEIDPRLEYSVEGMSEEEFRGLFDAPDRYSSQDLVCGMKGKTAIRFAMVHGEKKAGWWKRADYTDIFKGLLFVAQFNKAIRATTHVSSERAGFFDNLNHEHVKLEDTRFNELYHVSSSDQIEARYILTPDMMERFVALKREFNEVSAVFFEDQVALALEADYRLLDPNLEATLDLRQSKTLLRKLRMLTGIVEELDLNTRIWTVK